MGVMYRKAGALVTSQIAELVRLHHPHLAFVEAEIDALFYVKAIKGILVPGLELHGYRAAAIVQATSHRHRVAGLADALITIDRCTWENDLGEDERRAVIDHELEHLKVEAEGGGLLEVTDNGEMRGEPKYDAGGRPKLTVRNHDWHLGGFRVIAQRYGDAALGVQAARAVLDKTTGQYAWDLGKAKR